MGPKFQGGCELHCGAWLEGTARWTAISVSANVYLGAVGVHPPERLGWRSHSFLPSALSPFEGESVGIGSIDLGSLVHSPWRLSS